MRDEEHESKGSHVFTNWFSMQLIDLLPIYTLHVHVVALRQENVSYFTLIF